jgi:hypothetical protein
MNRSINRKLFLFFLTICFFAGNCKNAFSVTKNWTGATSQAWNTPGNWQGGTFPATADDVVIDPANYPAGRSPIISANPTNNVNKLTIQNNGLLTVTGGTATFNNALVMTSGGDLTITTGLITFNANSTIDGVGTTLTMSGTLAGSKFTTSSTSKLDIGGTTAGATVNISGGTMTISGNMSIDGAGTTFTLSDVSGTKAKTALTMNNTSKIIIGANAAGAAFTFSGGTLTLDNNISVDRVSTFTMSGTPTSTSIIITNTSKITVGNTVAGALFDFQGGSILVDLNVEVNGVNSIFRMTGSLANTTLTLAGAGNNKIKVGTATAGALFDLQAGTVTLDDDVVVDGAGSEFRMSGTTLTTDLNITGSKKLKVGVGTAGALFTLGGGSIDVTENVQIDGVGTIFNMSGSSALNIANTATNGLIISTAVKDAVFNFTGGTITVAADNVIVDKGGRFNMNTGTPVLTITAGALQIQNAANGASYTYFKMDAGTTTVGGALEIGNATDVGNATPTCEITGGTFTASSTTSFLGSASSNAPHLVISGGITTLTGAVSKTTSVMDVDISGSASLIFKDGLNMSAAGDRFDQTGTSTIQFDNTKVWTNAGIFTANGAGSTGTVIFNGSTTLTLSGTPTWNFYSVQINNGKTLNQSTATTINVAGNWTNNTGTYTHNNQTVQLNGTGTQTIGGTSSTTFYNLTFNNDPATAGDVTLATNNYIVNNQITMTQGNVNLNGRTLTLGTAVGSPGTLSYTAGFFYGSTGTFTRWISATSAAIGAVAANELGHFPMGSSSGDYRPLWFTYSSNLTAGGTVSLQHDPTTLTASASHNDASWGAGTTVLAVTNSNWVISSANGFALNGATGTIRFGGQGYGTNTLADLDATLAASTLGTFSAATNSITTIEVNRTALTTANLANTWRIGTRNPGSSPLPIELLSFDAKPNDNHVDLNWTTATEINNDFFTIEKSTDASTFESVGTVKGAGNSNTVLNYSMEDNNPVKGISYYRLKQTDFDGKFTYSNTRAVKFDYENFTFNIFPNPTTVENINLSFKENSNEEILVVVYDANGKKDFSKTIIIQANGNNIYPLDPSHKLSPGIYMITATSDQSIYSKKLIVK